MPKIFISYRRDDTLGLTGRIFDRLKSHFGHESVVMDIDSIPLGADFRRYITDAISECDALLAVIGDRWLGPEAHAKRRLDDPEDFVRLEIETALGQGLTVIPVLVGTYPMPSEDDLPAPLKSLAYRNALRIDVGRDFHHHLDHLIRALDQLPSSRKARVTEEPLSPDYSAISRERSQHPTTSPAYPVVEIASGPDKGKTFELIKDRALIGRDPSCDLPLKHGSFLSRFHAQFVKMIEGYGFEDLGSANGSYVNGVRVSGRVTLKDGDLIQAGQVVLIYRSRG